MQEGAFYLDGLGQDCSLSIANALEILQSCTKPSICVVAVYGFMGYVGGRPLLDYYPGILPVLSLPLTWR